MQPQEAMKRAAAEAALRYVQPDRVVGVGTGSTVRYFIEALGRSKVPIRGAVASSVATEAQLKAAGIPLLSLNESGPLPLYVDGADEVDPKFRLIKGGGGALTREKILAAASRQFVCIVDAAKQVTLLGREFPVPVEVIPMARSFVARAMVALGGRPAYREGCITDNGCEILDVYNLELLDPVHWEQQLNAIPGVVAHGIFAGRTPEVLIVGTKAGVHLEEHME